MSYSQFLLYLLMYIKGSKLVSFTAFDDKHLDVENLKMYTTMSYKMCLRECSKTMRCMSINYNSDQLECFLLETSHTESMLSDKNGFTYAFPEPGQKCGECESEDTCIQLHKGRNVCIKTECSQERPTVQNASTSQSYNPPFVSFECLTGYTGVGSQASSTCRPGEPWSTIDYRCEQIVNGGWSIWGSWGSCSNCGGGTRNALRRCNNPSPQHGGTFCIGSSSKSETCKDACGRR